MKKDILYMTNTYPNKTSLFELFKSVNWDEGTNAEQLYTAMCRSTHTVTAWHDTQLVGFIRSMDDNILSSNIDFLLVHKRLSRAGNCYEFNRLNAEAATAHTVHKCKSK